MMKINLNITELKMYYVEERKLEDIAREMDRSVKTVFCHRNTALRMIKERYESGLPLDVLVTVGLGVG